MNYTPLDIENLEIKKSAIGGFSESEVMTVLDNIVEDYKSFIKEAANLREKNESMNAAIVNYKAMEETLQSTLLVAQQNAEEVKSAAQGRADNIIKEAELRAKEIITKANSDIYESRKQMEQLKLKVATFKMQVRSVLEMQMELLNQMPEGFVNAEDEIAASAEPKEPKAKRVKEAEGVAEMPEKLETAKTPEVIELPESSEKCEPIEVHELSEKREPIEAHELSEKPDTMEAEERELAVEAIEPEISAGGKFDKIDAAAWNEAVEPVKQVEHAKPEAAAAIPDDLNFEIPEEKFDVKPESPAAIFQRIADANMKREGNNEATGSEDGVKADEINVSQSPFLLRSRRAGAEYRRKWMKKGMDE